MGEVNKFISHTNQLWTNANEGYHINPNGKKVDVSTISTGHARCLLKWYSNIPLTDVEMKRVINSKVYKKLERVVQ